MKTMIIMPLYLKPNPKILKKILKNIKEIFIHYLYVGIEIHVSLSNMDKTSNMI